MSKRYQIFISSTYQDLKEERAGVLRQLLDLGHLPAGMELFPCTEKNPLDCIKKVIDQADYYLLIVGARYGSTDNTGLSYTEQELQYALDKNIPVFIFMREKIDCLTAGKTEITPQNRAKIFDFRKRLQEQFEVSFWDTHQELEGKIFVNLSRSIFSDQRPTWQKSSNQENQALIEKIQQLTTENQTLTIQNQQYQKQLTNNALEHTFNHADEKLILYGTVEYLAVYKPDIWHFETTWKSLLLTWGPRLLSWTQPKLAIEDINSAIARSSPSMRPFINETLFHDIKFNLINCGMLEINKENGYIKLTPAGEQYLRDHN